MGRDRLANSGGGTIVKIGCTGPQSAETWNIEAGKAAIEALASGGFDRSHIAEHSERAVGEFRTAVAGCAVLGFENRAAGNRCCGQCGGAAAGRAVTC